MTTSAFKPVDPAQLNRKVVSVWGGPKEGKTHFTLTAPPPIRVINLDHGIRELLHKFKDKQIEIADFAMTEQTDAGTFGTLLKGVHEQYLWALDNTPGGTVVVDTATQLWQIVQTVKLDSVLQQRIATYRAKHGKEPDLSDRDVKLYPFHFAAANSYYGGLLRRAMQQFDTNVIFVHRAKERWDEAGRPTGQPLFQGFNETPAIVQMTIQFVTKNKKVIGRIDSCRFDKELEGLEVENLQFDTLLEMVG